mgnify:CR=1 FL=1
MVYIKNLKNKNNYNIKRKNTLQFSNKSYKKLILNTKIHLITQ